MAAGATLSIFGARIVASQYRAFCLAQGHNLLSQNPTAPKIPGSVDDQVRCRHAERRVSERVSLLRFFRFGVAIKLRVHRTNGRPMEKLHLSDDQMRSRHDQDGKRHHMDD